jgi:hypothetical protein
MLLRGLLVLSLVWVQAAAQSSWTERVLGQAPTPHPASQSALGHALGSRASQPEEIVAFARALAGERVKLLEVGHSVTGRPLLHAIVSAPENLARLDDIAGQHRHLLEQGGIIPDGLPVQVTFCMSVHGNELSGSEAGLALLRHLATANAREVQTILEHVVLEIALDMNPDGRARTVTSQRDRSQWRGEEASDSFAHTDAWPGGRVNSHWFDLNRDWYLQTQPETRARVARLVHAPAQVIADFHEMGADDGYFAATPAGPPVQALVGPEVRAMLALLDQSIQKSFDGAGRALWNADRFPADYPGYGGAWGTFSGAAALTLEQASAGAGQTRRNDDTLLPFEEACENHLRAAWSILQRAAEEHVALLRLFAEHSTRVRAEAARQQRPDFIFAPSGDLGLLAHLAETLLRNGISVQVLKEARTLDVLSLSVNANSSAVTESVSFPAGALVVKSAQGRGALVRALLDPELPQDEAFAAAEAQRHNARARSERYDVSAWCLGLLSGLRGYRGAAIDSNELSAWTATESSTSPATADGVLWATRTAGVFGLRAAANLQRQGIRLRHVPFEFTTAGRTFAAGTCIALAERNREPAVRDAILAAVQRGDLIPLQSAASVSGHDPASWRTQALLNPDIVLLVGEGTHPNSAGALAWLLHDVLSLPVRRVNLTGLASALEHATALVLPDGGYARGCGEKDIQAFLARGGVVVALGAAVSALASKDGPLHEWKKPEKSEDFAGFNGLIVEGQLLPEHWLCAGLNERTSWPLRGALAVRGQVATGPGRVVLNGVKILSGQQPDAASWIGNLPLITDWPVERGRVVAFAGDPIARGMAPVAWNLLVRALLLGPSMSR